MAAGEVEQFGRAARLLQPPQRLLAGGERHHRILAAVAEQGRWGRLSRLPALMGVATAGDQPCQRQLRTHIHRHRAALGEAQQHGVLQRHLRRQILQPLPQRGPRRRQGGPVDRLQPIPLAPHAHRVGLGRSQRHHAHRRPHQQAAQIEQIVGVGAPAMQQHQAPCGRRRALAQRTGVGTAGGEAVLSGGHGAAGADGAAA